jgi:diguanylate cyclase (GGDEF)-like protein
MKSFACCCRTPTRPARAKSAKPCAPAVQALGLPHTTSSHQCVTVSVGVASTQPNTIQRPGDLIEAADAALYAAKHRGRNTVVEHGMVRVSEGAAEMAWAS